MMRGCSTFFVFIGLILRFITPSKFPTELEQCRKDDDRLDECLAAAIQKALPHLARGLPHAGLVPLDPLFTPHLEMTQRGLVTINTNFSNTITTGFSRSTIPAVRSDIPNYSITVFGFVPKLVIAGDYVTKMNILFLPIEGAGKYEVTMEKINGSITVIGESFKKKTHNHLRVVRVDCDINPEKVIFNLKNLFNGDEILGNYANQFLNRFSSIIYKFSKSMFEETLGKVYAELAGGFFNEVPYEDIYL